MRRTSTGVEQPRSAPRPGLRHYIGVRCDSVSLDGYRCERAAAHDARRGPEELHRAVVAGIPRVWSERA